jgi:hypothetical protein
MNTAGTQEAVATEVNERMARATADLQEKYARGKGGVEESVTAPTGSAYKELEAKENKERAERKETKRAQSQKNQVTASEMEVGDDEDDEGEGNEDYELRLIKEARLKQIKNAHKEKLENMGKGHGQFREIVQDEFIANVTSSPVVVCMFFHRDFPRCTIMEHHLQKLAQRHIETKFVKINAEKAPFFVEKVRDKNIHSFTTFAWSTSTGMKLKIIAILFDLSFPNLQLMIRTMPTVVIFSDGVAIDKILGFEGLADAMPEGQEDSWPTIVLARLLAAKCGINNSAIIDDDEIEANMQVGHVVS